MQVTKVESAFRNRFNRPEYKGVEMLDHVVTEQNGYVSTEEQVERMILAGERLRQYRLGILDAYDREGVDEEEQLPIDRYEKDMVDAEEEIVRHMRFVETKKEKARKKAEAEGASDVKESENAKQEVVSKDAEASKE